MSMYNVFEYSDNYAKASGSLWQYCKDVLPLDNNNRVSFFTKTIIPIHLILKRQSQVKLEMMEQKMLK